MSGCGHGKVSQIFHSVFITFCFRRSEGCENLPQTCYPPKVEDLGHLPLGPAVGELEARLEGGGERSAPEAIATHVTPVTTHLGFWLL